MSDSNERYIIIWPQYLDSTLPRRLGRRVPKHSSVPKPLLEELITVCEGLNLRCKAEPEKKYSRAWYLGGGRVIIYTNERKSVILKLLACGIKELRVTRKDKGIKK